MPGTEHRSPAAVAPRGDRGPYWRALLEARWQERLHEVTELSLAYHVADPDGRLAAGNFGSCEQCGSALPPALLAASRETRYCPRCAAGAAPAAALRR